MNRQASDLEDPASVADNMNISSFLEKMTVESDAPVLVTPHGTVDALETIKSFTAKHNVNNFDRVTAAVSHYEPQIDFDALLSPR